MNDETKQKIIREAESEFDANYVNSYIKIERYSSKRYEPILEVKKNLELSKKVLNLLSVFEPKCEVVSIKHDEKKSSTYFFKFTMSNNALSASLITLLVPELANAMVNYGGFVFELHDGVILDYPFDYNSTIISELTKASRSQDLDDLK